MARGELMPPAQAGYLEDYRIQALLDPPQNTPPRSLDYGERDRFKLLSVEDTFEPVVSVLFDGCEAMEDHLLKKRDRRHREVALPEVSFDNARRFLITRSTKGDSSKEYHFQRSGDPSSGFVILRAPEGNILLRHPEQGDTDTTDDKDYHSLITQATNFLQTYAKQCGMTPELLASYKEPKPERKKRNISPLAKKAAQIALLTTVYVGVPGYCVYGSLETGRGWESAAAKHDHQKFEAEVTALKSQNNAITSTETSLGKLCAAAITSYSPNSTLGYISVSDAATQLQREDRCDAPGENTQLEVQNYRNEVNNANNTRYQVGQLRDRWQGQLKDVAFENFGLVVAGLAVGGVGDAIFGFFHSIVRDIKKDR